MFDIDKMYLMFPSFKPQYNINKKLRNYVYKNLRGKTKLETIDNINAVIDQINSDYDTDFNVDEFSESLLNLDINDITDEENLLLNDNISLFVDIILKTKKESPLLNYIKEESEITKVSKLRYENYDNSKPESEQTKAALQNRLIELYKSVLLNENVIGEVMTPVDFTHIKDDILHFVNKKPTTNLSTFNQLDDIDTKYDFSAGKAGVGQQANALMDYVLGSLGNLSITNFNVPKSNNRFDLEYSNTLSDEDIKYYLPIAKKTYENTDAWKKDKIPFNEKEATKQLKSIKIGHSLSAILNAFVDIAKDPYITRGNWVTMTTNTGNLLLRKGVHPFYVNAFLNQPILKEYVEFSASYESSKNQGLSTQDAFIKERFNTNKLSGKDNYELILDKFKYEKNIFNSSLETLRSEANKNNIDYQARVFYTFLQYQSASKAIKDNINASKFMVDGIGGSVNSLIIAKNAVDSILEAEDRYNKLEDKSEFKENIILGFRSKFKNPNGSESIFSKYFNNVILEPLKIVRANPTLFLESNQTIQNTFNEISYDLKNQILVDFEKGNKNLGKILNKTFYSYIMSGFQSLNIQNQERKDLVLKFPKEFEQFQKDNKGKYIIIDQMTVNLGNTLEFVSLNNRKKSQDFEKLMIGSFLDLLNTNEEFANKLIKYSYLTSGFNNHSSQFFTMIPTQWFNRNNINRYIIDTNDSYNSYIDKNDDFFINQFYLANLENRKYVKNVSGKQILENSLNIHGFVLDTPGKAGYYRVKVDDLGQNPDIYYKLIGYDEEYRGVYSRFIPNINDQLSEIKLLNVKDKKGNRIINYDTNGINLKPVTETSPGVAKNINKKILSDLHDSAIYPRDKFYKGGIVEKDEVVKTEQKIINKTDVLKKQNIFTVKPIQTVDKKATVKASVATQYIGFGEGIVNSSTENYRQQAGEYANTGNYSAEDIIFVSIGGKRGNETVRKSQQDKTIKEALKAIEAGATLITDNKSYVEGSDYNEGEKRLAKNLETKGYNYSEQTVDGQILGVWTNEVKVDNIVEVDDNLENNNIIDSDIFQYYGLKYKITLENNIAVNVLNYKGKLASKQKILDAYNNNKNIDPQNGKNFRNEESTIIKNIEKETEPELTEDQQKVSTFIQDFLSKPVNNSVDSFSVDNMIMITGPGGTGKTFTITRAIKEFSKKEYLKVAFAAPTHNAKRELTLSMLDAGFVQPAMTNLSLFGIEYNPLSGKSYLKPVNDFYKPLIYYTNVVILDEYSMLGGDSLKLIKERLQEIKEKEGRNIQIIFSGDYGQIPPVVDTKLSTDYSDGEITNLIYHNNKDKVVSLTKNMRSKYEDVAKQGQILRGFIDRVNDIFIYKNSNEKIEDVSNDFKNNFLKIKDITKNVNIYPEESKLEWIDNYLKLFRQNSKDNLKFGVIVNYNNENHAYTSKINNYIRKELFNTNEKFVNGELVMMQSNEFEARKDNNTLIIVGKEERLLINEVNKINKKFTFEYRNKGSRDTKYFSMTVPVFEINAKNDIDENVNFYSLNLQNKIIDYFKDNSQLDVKDLNLTGEIPLNTKQIFVLVSKQLADIAYGYVVNSHKVQGSSYGETFVDEDNIATAKNFKEQLQLLYTAYTRSKFKTHVKTSLVMKIDKVEDFVKQENLLKVDDVVENKTENKSEISQIIYDELGNKTQSKNVILPKDVDPEADNIGMKYTTAIDFWRKIVPEAITLYSKAKPLIVAFRGNSKKTFLENYNSGSYTIGNPFNFMNESGNRKEQGIKATKKFIEWMITGNNQNNNDATEKYRQAIIKDIKSGKLKGSSILYYEEKNYATHATALDYLINEYNWETNNIISNKPQQLSLFDKNDDWQNEDNDDTCVPF